MRKNLSTADKREREKQVVDLMIALYCRKKHHTAKEQLCPECLELRSYSYLRSDHCPFMEVRPVSPHKLTKGEGCN